MQHKWKCNAYTVVRIVVVAPAVLRLDTMVPVPHHTLLAVASLLTTINSLHGGTVARVDDVKAGAHSVRCHTKQVLLGFLAVCTYVIV